MHSYLILMGKILAGSIGYLLLLSLVSRINKKNLYEHYYTMQFNGGSRNNLNENDSQL